MKTAKPPLGPVLRHYGLDYIPDGYNRSVRCPFHDDTVKSASINSTEGLFQCFTCGVRGDVYAVIMQKEGCDFLEAKRLAEEIAASSGETVSSEPAGGTYLSFGKGNHRAGSYLGRSGSSGGTRTWA